MAHFVVVAAAVMSSILFKPAKCLDKCNQEAIKDDYAYGGWPYLIPCNLVGNFENEYESGSAEFTNYTEYHDQYSYDSSATTVKVGVDDIACMLENSINIIQLTPNDAIISALDSLTGKYLMIVIKCEIWDAPKNRLVLLFNETYNMSNMEDTFGYKIYNFVEEDARNYEIRLSVTDQCSFVKLRLHIKEFPKMSCQDAVTTIEHLTTEVSFDDEQSLHCQVPYSHDFQIPHHLLTNYTVEWFHNCNPLRKAGIIRQPNDVDLAQIYIPHVRWSHLGVYTCVVTHNNMTRYVAHHNFCVRPRVITTQHRIKCNRPTYLVSLHEQAVIECDVFFGLHLPSINFYASITWRKIPQNNTLQCEEESDKHERTSCTYTRNQTCYTRAPSRKDRRISNKVTVQVTINDVQDADMGPYVLSVSTDEFLPAFEIVTLELNKIPPLTNFAILYGTMLGLILFFLILIMLLYWQRVYVQLLWKRKFSAYDADDKTYGAFFSYHYSSDLDKFAQLQTRDVVSAVCDELTKLGYSIYDEYKDGYEAGLRTETIISLVKQCHRVVIVLTPEYMKDHWSLFTLHKSFEEMIKSESRMIFVLVPGVKEYLKQHSKTGDTFRMIQRAIKLNDVIQWSDDINFAPREFSALMELFMPKLRSQKAPRPISTSSPESFSKEKYWCDCKRTLIRGAEVSEFKSAESFSGKPFVGLVIDSDVSRKKYVL